jgi:hypothetical protein
MNLTNYIRDAFVRAAMQDVPQVDYDEKIRKAAVAAAVAAMPPKVRAFWESNKNLRGWVEQRSVKVASGISVHVPHPSDDMTFGEKLKNLPEIVELKALSDEQQETRNSLQAKLRSAAYGVKTKKALVAMLPEFEKYLPADEPAAIRTLPVAANVVADFVKAGWPKGGAQ